MALSVVLYCVRYPLYSLYITTICTSSIYNHHVVKAVLSQTVLWMNPFWSFCYNNHIFSVKANASIKDDKSFVLACPFSLPIEISEEKKRFIYCL